MKKIQKAEFSNLGEGARSFLSVGAGLYHGVCDAMGSPLFFDNFFGLDFENVLVWGPAVVQGVTWGAKSTKRDLKEYSNQRKERENLKFLGEDLLLRETRLETRVKAGISGVLGFAKGATETFSGYMGGYLFGNLVVNYFKGRPDLS